MFDPTSEKLERHVPEHPLPKEIKEMPHDATVCKFCGVSYLIHHEMKKLEEKVAKLELQLANYQQMKEQYCVIKDENENSKTTIRTLRLSVSQKEQMLESITTEFEQIRTEKEIYMSELQASESTLRKNKENFGQWKKSLCRSLIQIKDLLALFKKDFYQTKDAALKILPEFNVLVSRAKKEMLEEIVSKFQDFENVEKSYEKSLNEMLVLRRENQIVKRDAAQGAKQLEEYKKVCEKLSTQLEVTKERSDKEATESNDKFSELNQKINLLQKENFFKENKISEIEYLLMTTREENCKVMTKAEETKEKLEHTVSRLEKEQKSMMKRSVECDEELHQLVVSVKEKESRIASLLQQIDYTHGKSDALEKALDDTRENVHKLILEREENATKHQEQIQQLCRDFEEKIKKLETDRNGQNEKVMSEIDSQVAEIKLDHQAELNIANEIKLNEIASLKKKHKLEVQKIEHDFCEKSGSLMRELSKVKNTLDSTYLELHDKEDSFEKEKSSLKKTIDELQTRIGQMSVDHAGLHDISDFKRNEREVKDLQDVNIRLNRTITNQNLQIQKLEDTVRLECEERFELLNALSHTHIQRIDNKQQAPVWGDANLPVSAINSLHHRIHTPTTSIQNREKQRSQTVALPIVPSKNNSNSNKASNELINKQRSSSSSRESVDVNFLRKRIAQTIKKRNIYKE